MATQRVEIPISFSYPKSVFVALSSGGGVTTSVSVAVPASGSSVTVIDRNTSNPATVFAAATGGSTLSSITTDSGGNVPGFVVEGSYAITAAAAGAFAGATINWEAVRGDGVENIFPGAVTTTALATAVAQALVPTGTILDFGGSSAPSGFHLCDGSVQSQSGTFANLFAVVGTHYNTGGEGAGNFRLPNTKGRFNLGLAASGTGSTLGAAGGAIDHTHSIPGLSIPALGVPHNHGLSQNGGVAIGFFGFGDGAALLIGRSPFSNVNMHFDTSLVTLTSTGDTGNTGTAFALIGNTDSASPNTNTGTTGTGTTGTNNPPFLAVNKIIKL